MDDKLQNQHRHWQLEVPPTLNPDLLQQALQQLLLHHDALRLRFNQSEAEMLNPDTKLYISR